MSQRTDAEAVRAVLVGVIDGIHTLDADQIRWRLLTVLDGLDAITSERDAYAAAAGFPGPAEGTLGHAWGATDSAVTAVSAYLERAPNVRAQIDATSARACCESARYYLGLAASHERGGE